MPRIVRLADDLMIVPDTIAIAVLLEPYHSPMQIGRGWVVAVTLVFGQQVVLKTWPERTGIGGLPDEPARELEASDGIEARTLYERVLTEIAIDV